LWRLSIVEFTKKSTLNVIVPVSFSTNLYS
jgi:hypothetical protein